MSKPITLEEMKAWIDATWEKCQSEAWREPRQWVGLTDEQILELNFDGEFCIITDDDEAILKLARAIEAKLKEKNT